jgi:hypothetical protein
MVEQEQVIEKEEKKEEKIKREVVKREWVDPFNYEVLLERIRAQL